MTGGRMHMRAGRADDPQPRPHGVPAAGYPYREEVCPCCLLVREFTGVWLLLLVGKDVEPQGAWMAGRRGANDGLHHVCGWLPVR